MIDTTAQAAAKARRRREFEDAVLADARREHLDDLMGAAMHLLGHAHRDIDCPICRAGVTVND